MSSSGQATSRTNDIRDTLAPWLELLRPRVAGMVYLVAWLGAALAATSATGGFWALSEVALYVTLIAGSASVFNQVIERETDALMPRTMKRPLVVGSIGARDAILFGTALGVISIVGLALRFNMLSAFLALATFVLYVVIYTPLKRLSSVNTVVGAIAGAAPPLLAYAAVSGGVDSWAWLLFAVMFGWQFPHFMAIAWLYRDDYRAGGMRMLPALPNSDGLAGRQAVLYSVSLLPVSLLPVLHGMAGPVYFIGTAVVGLAYLASSVAFQRREDAPRARVLLYVSLVYLPVLFVLILADPLVQRTLVL